MFEWTRDVPNGWQEQLDRICPHEDEKVSWLKVAWQPGWDYEPVQRWVIYEMCPIVQQLYDNGMVDALNGPNPRDIGTWSNRDGKKRWHSHSICSKLQWDLWREGERKYYPNIFWIIQGTKGGHQYKLPQWQLAFLKEFGLEKAETPLMGDLPYAELSQLTINQLAKADKLRTWLAALPWNERAISKASGGFYVSSERQQSEREFNEMMLKHLKDQISEGVSDIPRSLLPETNATKAVWVDEDATDQEFIQSTATRIIT